MKKTKTSARSRSRRGAGSGMKKFMAEMMARSGCQPERMAKMAGRMGCCATDSPEEKRHE